MNKVNKKNRIAVQNKGRLMNPSLDYLRRCGLEFVANGRNYIVPCGNFNMELLFVRNSDIPEYVKCGVADYGIVGENLLMEKTNRLEVVRRLEFGKCELVIAVPQNSTIDGLASLEHERIATSYPRTLKAVLKERGVSASVIEIQGSVEICPSLGLVDAIFDITQTGQTLRENGLKVIEKIADSQAVLIKNFNTNPNYENLFV